ncbi:sugar phosphate isomerase/epimerase [archaeon]|jgi:sugar phosphate isomerase/epimerase|nr:sugar phosphate isomerase/epimerase [archaeon]
MIVGVPSRTLPIKKNLKILKKIGYDGFQFDLSVCGIDTFKKSFLLDSEEDKCVKKIKKLSQDLNFPVLAAHTFYPLNSEDDTIIETFKKHLEHLKILNCKYLILHISGYNKDKQRLKKAINNLNKIKSIYKKKGCEILLENDHKPSLFITIKDIEKITSKIKLNLCFDVTHAMQSNVNLDNFYSKFNKKIKAFHLSDFKEGKAHKEIGTGILKKFNCFKKIIASKKLLILEVGKDVKKAKTMKEVTKIYKNSFLEVKNK